MEALEEAYKVLSFILEDDGQVKAKTILIEYKIQIKKNSTSFIRKSIQKVSGFG